MSLEVTVASLRLKHPVMNASGVLGNTPGGVVKLAKLGFSAIVTKTITPEPREGFKPPTIVRLPTGGLINAVGLANPGKRTIKELVSVAKKLNVPIIVSIAGRSEKEFAEVACEAQRVGADAVELNLSCPHTEGYGLELGADPLKVRSVVESVASVTSVPVLAKLGLSDRVVEAASKALEAGAEALVLINTVKGIYIDVYALRPVLTAVYGGLSGPPIHPIAVRVVYDVYREYQAEIIGVGGILDWKTAAEFIVAGAKAVQVGTALVSNDRIVEDVLEGLRKWLQYFGAGSITELVGAAHKA
ncbi:MAG: dihydroorotate dehydrogenase [Desulfurococcales archaeon]|nr:dihydroorotate dehydrogenase [Desulfurococcales archaeon]